MRYRIGETPTEPVMSLDQGAFLAIAVLSLTIGAGLSAGPGEQAPGIERGTP